MMMTDATEIEIGTATGTDIGMGTGTGTDGTVVMIETDTTGEGTTGAKSDPHAEKVVVMMNLRRGCLRRHVVVVLLHLATILVALQIVVDAVPRILRALPTEEVRPPKDALSSVKENAELLDGMFTHLVMSNILLSRLK